MAEPPRCKRIPFLLVAIAATAAPLAGHAQAWIKPGEEAVILNLGGLTSRIDSSVRLDGNRGGTGIDLEGDTGLDSNRSTFYLGGSFRMATRHRIDAAYTAYDRSASRATQREYVIDDVVIPAGTVLTAEATTKIGYVAYRYSFVKRPDMELAAGLGLYGGNFKFRFDAASPRVNIDESTTLPLPVLALTGDFYLTDRAILRASVGGLKLKIGDVDGSVAVAGVAGEYLFTNNLGLGLSFDYFDVDVDARKGDLTGNAGLTTSKATLYLTGRF